MHESGLIRKLLDTARTEARRQGGALRAVHIRLGALAGGTAEHLREHFEHEASALGFGPIGLEIEEDPMRPSGVEIVAIEVAAGEERS